MEEENVGHRMVLMVPSEELSNKVGVGAQTAVAEVKEHAGREDRRDEAVAQFGTRIQEEVEEADPTLPRGLQDLRKLAWVAKETVDTMWLVVLPSSKPALMVE
jgi:hypothetical protein